MAKMNWEELQARFLAAHSESGISPQSWCEAQGLNYSSAKRYIKIANGGANSQKRTANKTANSQFENEGKSLPGKTRSNNAQSGNAQNSPKTKHNRRSGNPSPVPYFQPGNQHALKHGGYGRRMLLSDAISEDAQSLTLSDELFWLRASNLTAAESIGRWRASLDDAPDDAQRETLRGNIEAAEKAMHRNTARIESLEFTKASIAKTQSQDEKLKFETVQGSELLDLDIRKRTAEAERLEQEVELKRKGSGKDGEPTIVIKLVNSPDAE